MSDKPVAFFVTALVIAPVCSVCILGPAVVGGFLAGWFGWLADLDIALVTVLGGLAVLGVLGYFKYRRRRPPNPVRSGSGRLE